MVRLIKASAFICVHRLPLSKGGVQEISTGHGEDRGFCCSGVGSFLMGFGRKMGRVTEAEHELNEPVIAPETKTWL